MKLSFERLTNWLGIEGKRLLNQFIGDVENNFKETTSNTYKAQTDATKALSNSSEAVQKANNAQAQVDTLVIGSNTSPAETVQARVDNLGNTFNTLKDRIDNEANKIGNLQKKTDWIDVQDYSPVGDGNSHPLSERFPTLTLAKMKYPHATSLTDEIDWCAIQGAINNLSNGDKLKFSDKTYFINKGLVLDKMCVTFEGHARGYYNMSTIKSLTPNLVLLTVTQAGFFSDKMRYLGDGDLYGVGSTITALELIGGFTSNPNYDLDAILQYNSFFKVKKAVRQRGKNLIVENNNFSNSTIGIEVIAQGTPNDFRGLEMRHNRFHSLGGSFDSSSICVSINVTDGFREFVMTDNYFDDCNKIFKGGAITLDISDNTVARGYGGIEADMTGSPVTIGYDKRVQKIKDNILLGAGSININNSGITVKETTGGSGRWVIDGNQVSNFAYHGIALYGVKSSTIKTNYLDQIASDAAGVYDYIYIDSLCEKISVESNTLNNPSANVRYGINILSTLAGYNFLSNNSFYGFTSGKEVNISTTSRTLANDGKLGVATLSKVKNNALGVGGTYTLKTGIDSPVQRQASTLTSDLTVTLANPYCEGAYFKIIRQGGGAFTFTVNSGGALGSKTLAQNEYVELEYSQQAGVWLFTGKGQV